MSASILSSGLASERSVEAFESFESSKLSELDASPSASEIIAGYEAGMIPQREPLGPTWFSVPERKTSGFDDTLVGKHKSRWKSAQEPLFGTTSVDLGGRGPGGTAGFGSTWDADSSGPMPLETAFLQTSRPNAVNSLQMMSGKIQKMWQPGKARALAIRQANAEKGAV